MTEPGPIDRGSIERGPHPSTTPDSPELEPVADAQIDARFGANAARARQYAELLCTDGIVRGMIGPAEAGRIWSRHLFNSAALAALVPADAEVIDLGSGAGLPGIPLALARPDLTVTLLEPLARRVRFLTDVLAALAVPTLAIQHSRAEAAPQGSAQIVVARAVAPLPRLVELAFPLLRSGGVLLALKGANAADEAAVVDADGRWTTAVRGLDAHGGSATVVEVRRAGQ